MVSRTSYWCAARSFLNSIELCVFFVWFFRGRGCSGAQWYPNKRDSWRDKRYGRLWVGHMLRSLVEVKSWRRNLKSQSNSGWPHRCPRWLVAADPGAKEQMSPYPETFSNQNLLQDIAIATSTDSRLPHSDLDRNRQWQSHCHSIAIRKIGFAFLKQAYVNIARICQKLSEMHICPTMLQPSTLINGFLLALSLLESHASPPPEQSPDSL